MRAKKQEWVNSRKMHKLNWTEAILGEKLSEEKLLETFDFDFSWEKTYRADLILPIMLNNKEFKEEFANLIKNFLWRENLEHSGAQKMTPMQKKWTTVQKKSLVNLLKFFNKKF